MKRILLICFVFLSFLGYDKVSGQGFVTAIEDEGFSALFRNECILKLGSGEEIRGKFVGGTYIKNGLTKISVRLENGEKVKWDDVALHVFTYDQVCR